MTENQGAASLISMFSLLLPMPCEASLVGLDESFSIHQ